MVVTERSAALATRSLSWRALGSTATVYAPQGRAFAAYAAVAPLLERVDHLASRFRSDSELTRINRRAGEWTPISGGFLELLHAALRAAAETGGAVDPTLGADLAALGYDRDFSELPMVGRSCPLTAPPPTARRRAGPRWESIELDEARAAIRIPGSIRLDLGATAKAAAADQCAKAAHAATDQPVLVSLGGDIATAGPAPAGGWAVAISGDHRDDPAEAAQTITIAGGGLATSSLLVRRWRRQGQVLHHVLDPTHGGPVTPRWSMVSVVALTCLEANTASTASLVLGERAPDWLAARALPARLVAVDGSVRVVGGWPR
jgi:thiamine biosynthesis lipoprotein